MLLYQHHHLISWMIIPLNMINKYRLHRKLFEVVGSGLNRPAVVEGDWKPLEAVGSRWKPLEAVGSRWKPLAVILKIWKKFGSEFPNVSRNALRSEVDFQHRSFRTF